MNWIKTLFGKHKRTTNDSPPIWQECKVAYDMSVGDIGFCVAWGSIDAYTVAHRQKAGTATVGIRRTDTGLQIISVDDSDAQEYGLSVGQVIDFTSIDRSYLNEMRKHARHMNIISAQNR